MNKKWSSVIDIMAIITVPALLVSMAFFSQPKREFISQYDEERLKNDSLMGEVQTLHKLLWEKEQELRVKNSHIDSLTLVCNNPETKNYQH